MTRPPRLSLPGGTFAGLFTAFVAVIAIGVTSFKTDQARTRAAGLVSHTLQVREQLEVLLSLAKDAETGQRGFLLTGDEHYLEPYTKAVTELPVQLDRLRRLVADNETQVRRLDAVQAGLKQKLDELRSTIELRRAGETERALEYVRTDRGRLAMDRVRDAIAEMAADERRLLDLRQAEWSESVQLTQVVVVGGSLLLLVLIAGTAYLLARDHKARETEAWLKTGQAALALELQGEQPVEQAARRALDYLTARLGALAGALYAREGDHFRRVAAVGAAPQSPELRAGDGLAGRALKEGRALAVRDVPKGYLTVGSSLGQSEARELLISPLAADGAPAGVVELAFFHAVEAPEAELLDRVAGSIGVALASAQQRQRLRELLEETQRQTEELSAQQSELETQQAELEANNEEMTQTNTLLGEQTKELEAQRDEVVRARDDAQRASRYKSEFLANMSHELRTPLNSALILARLLADNREGNLSADQIRSAETIYDAGNDLLVLINDILDLSKIEAGRVDLQPEAVALAKLTRTLEQSFRPVADEKHLGFRVTPLPGAPATLTTDPRRLEQILKNLLSNAFKFTQDGEVELVIAPDPKGVRFAVRDSGIGIAPEQQGVIFEAFRQADGTTSRKFGGTGLGLSISRELAQLLGGEISVESTPGRGSTFSFVLPLEAPARDEGRRPARAHAPRERRPGAPPAAARLARPPPFPDDRGKPARGRLVLVVEDDVAFARILYDLAHELDFDCVVASNAEDGLALARELQPGGVLLDVALPDGSGLAVLEQLKHDGPTRHIPVHIVSATDSTQAALELGAVGYALKPVAREDLVTAMKKIEAQQSRRVRRVLVVEDDPRQQESLGKLLGSEGVELQPAGSMKEALAALEKTSFDCMVLDLTLPDGSGYDLLEKMAEGTRWAFPPVIVYTGRELDRAAEERLRHYSRSIILKGAKSPERLLDEVSLFLHQVESKLPAEQRRMLETARQRDSAFEGRRILVVEDDVRNVFALSKILEPRGAKVEIARNGREALDALSKNGGFDLVLMDLMMPEMDGLTAIREIRKRKALDGMPVIALTAKAMADDRDQAVAAGANDYMAKPFEVDKLVSLCRVWLPR